MERSGYFKALPGDIRARYEEKLEIIGGIDPYLLKLQDFEDIRDLPEISMMDLVNYLILTCSFYTGQQLKAFKSLQAYKFYQSGLVQNVGAKRINSNAYVVVGKVKHSQKFREKPLDVWLIILQDGSVSSGHCTCMAGLGEACSHIAAILFFLNDRPSTTGSEACTSLLAQWPVPPLRNAEMCRVKDIDWARSIKTKAPTGVPRLSKGEMGQFLEKLHNIGVTSAAARLVEPLASVLHQEQEIPESLPLPLPQVFKDDFVGKSYDELQQVARNISITITEEEIKNVELITRKQSLSTIWFDQKSGRITSSVFKAVCRTSIEKPSISLIKGICYPRKMLFTSKQTKYGLKHEEEAINTFVKCEAVNHVNFAVTNAGLYISKRFPELGASPDGIFTCDCCGKGCIEVKCPYMLKGMSLADFAQKKTTCLKVIDNKFVLDRQHTYYYQVQLQMFVTHTTVCYFIIWSRDTLFIEKIELDDEFCKVNIVKALNFFNCVIKPELLGKFFTDKAGLASISLWCICKNVDDGRRMIKCDNDDCNIRWFHFECVGLNEVPETNWYCKNCKC